VACARLESDFRLAVRTLASLPQTCSTHAMSLSHAHPLSAAAPCAQRARVATNNRLNRNNANRHRWADV